MSVGDEIAAIEAVIDDLEKKISDGRLSKEAYNSYVQTITRGMSEAEVNANQEEIQKKISDFLGEERIDKNRIRELKIHHPNDSRINQLAHRALDCYSTIQNFSVSADTLKLLKDGLPGLFGL